jgi:hypothetical protein
MNYITFYGFEALRGIPYKINDLKQRGKRQANPALTEEPGP